MDPILMRHVTSLVYLVDVRLLPDADLAPERADDAALAQGGGGGGGDQSR